MKHRTMAMSATVCLAAIIAGCGAEEQAGPSSTTSGSGDTSPAGSDNLAPAGADATSIEDWTDPRPPEWTESYPYFGPVATGDGSLERVQQAGKLMICASLGFAPYAYYEAGTKDVAGFEYDMAQYFAEALGVPSIEYKNLDFSALIPAVGSGSCDFVMTGIGIRTDRASAPGVKFTSPYMKLFDQITVREDSSIGSLEDLAGKTIASTVASTDLQIAEAYAEEQLPGAVVVGFNTTNECFQAVATKNADACWLDVASTSTAIAEFPGLKVVGDAIPYIAVGSFKDDATANPYQLGAVGLVTNADDGDLNLALSLAIQQMIADGTQQKILEEWNLWSPEQQQLVRSDA